MKKKQILITVLVLLVGSFLVYLYQTSDRTGTDAAASKYAAGTEEEPHERSEYEARMLRNPITGTIPDGIKEKELTFAKNLPNRGDYKLAKGLAKRQFDWNPLGPVNISGRTRGLAYDVNNENTLIAGGISGGIFKSVDGGASWYKTTRSHQLHSVTTIAQDTRNGKTNEWYAGSGEVNGNSANATGANYFGNGIYKSVDNGESWEFIPSTTSQSQISFDSFFDYVMRVDVDPSETTIDEVYAACAGGILRSEDGGDTWSLELGSSQFNQGSVFTDVMVTSSGVAYAALSTSTIIAGAASHPGIWIAEDGKNWVDITPGDFPEFARRIVMASPSINENIVYFLAETPGSGVAGHTLLKYTHSPNGGTWENRSAGIPNNNPLPPFTTQNSYCIALGVKPDNPDAVFIGGVMMYRSTDGFASVENTSLVGGIGDAPLYVYDNHWVDQHVFLFSETDPDVMYTGNDGGVSRTDNCLAADVEWTRLSNGYITSQFYRVAIDEKTQDDDFVIGGLQDRGSWYTETEDASEEWEQVLVPGDGSEAAVAPGKQDLYVSIQRSKIFRIHETDGGETIITRIDPVPEGVLFINSFVLDPNDSSRMYIASAEGVWRNSDLYGIPFENEILDSTLVNWDKIEGTETIPGLMSAIAISENPKDVLYYGTSGGKLVKVSNAASDFALVEDITPTGIFPQGYISCIEVNPNDAAEVMVIFSNYGIPSIYHTDNGGITWSSVSGNLEENPDGSGNGPSVRWAEMLFVNDQPVYFVGTSAGLFSTTNLNGANTVWELEGPEVIGSVVVSNMAVRQADGKVVAATHGAGVYYANISAVTSVDEEAKEIRNSYELAQNFPNPFNPATTINYTVPQAGNVTLKVYDELGREVSTLVNEVKSPGTHQVNFNAAELASGVYFYTIEAGSFRESKKMILLK